MLALKIALTPFALVALLIVGVVAAIAFDFTDWRRAVKAGG